MSQRMGLTVIWLTGMIACLVIVELYFHRTVDGGIPFVFPDQRFELLRPLVTLYGAHIAGILGSWFILRFEMPSDPQTRALFAIALTCTLIWNLGAVYLVGQRHLWPEQSGTVLQDLTTAVQYGAGFSFLVGPINVYYFGIKYRTAQ